MDLLAGTAALGHATGDSLSGIENLVGANGGNDRLAGDDGDNVLTGFAGADFLTGNGGDDVLFLGVNDEAIDRAIFSEAGFGHDTVVQFEDDTDIIDLRGLGLSFDDITATTQGNNVILTFDGLEDDQITLVNFDVANLDSSDFFF